MCSFWSSLYYMTFVISVYENMPIQVNMVDWNLYLIDRYIENEAFKKGLSICSSCFVFLSTQTMCNNIFITRMRECDGNNTGQAYWSIIDQGVIDRFQTLYHSIIDSLISFQFWGLFYSTSSSTISVYRNTFMSIISYEIIVEINSCSHLNFILYHWS